MTAPPLARLQLVLHYDGARFHGWQAQPATRTVQGEVERAVERLTGQRRRVVASGRTDAGVHATGQVAAVDVPGERWPPAEFLKAMNGVLPADVWLAQARRVDAAFHPRYDAIARTYQYRLGLEPEASSPFHSRWCWPLRARLDRCLLDDAAAAVAGARSFAAFAKTGQPQRGARCHVHAAGWDAWPGPGIAFTVTADRYLHHMVRYLVGTMVDVARGRRPLDEMIRLLQRPVDGLVTSAPAPPQGLFLVRVEYPEAALHPCRRRDIEAATGGTNANRSIPEA